jgi:hypothetical protein
MRLSAPTKTLFLLAVIVAIISLIPALGITLPVIGAHSYWILAAAFAMLAAGNLLSDA